jgi:GrpB-like predicted nucleotidyltransferase (UPF0157 family)
MIGQTAMIEIQSYDPRWAVEFERERVRLAAGLEGVALRIDHHGSTAVEGLAAKPIIDIQVSVARLHPMDPYADRLQRLGYVHVPHDDDRFAPFFHRPAEWPHSHHVHVVTSGGAEERRTLAFRDYLRNHADAARAYEALKRILAVQFSSSLPDAREAYAQAKSDFVNEATARALAEGYPVGFTPKP